MRFIEQTAYSTKILKHLVSHPTAHVQFNCNVKLLVKASHIKFLTLIGRVYIR